MARSPIAGAGLLALAAAEHRDDETEERRRGAGHANATPAGAAAAKPADTAKPATTATAESFAHRMLGHAAGWRITCARMPLERRRRQNAAEVNASCSRFEGFVLVVLEHAQRAAEIIRVDEEAELDGAAVKPLVKGLGVEIGSTFSSSRPGNQIAGAGLVGGVLGSSRRGRAYSIAIRGTVASCTSQLQCRRERYKRWIFAAACVCVQRYSNSTGPARAAMADVKRCAPMRKMDQRALLLAVVGAWGP